MKSNRVLILWTGLLLGISGHSQQIQPYQNQPGADPVIGDNNQTKCKIGCADPFGTTYEKGQLADYYIELLPGSGYTGSWYYYNTGTTGDTSTANLVENPDVPWLTVSPTQFIDIGDGIATKFARWHLFVGHNSGALGRNHIIAINYGWSVRCIHN